MSVFARFHVEPNDASARADTALFHAATRLRSVEMHRREAQVVEALLHAYREGAFPMADPRSGRIEWFSPDPRAIMPLDPPRDPESSEPPSPHFHISRSLRGTLRSRRFTITTDTAFEGVVRSCAEARPERHDSWIDDRIITAYTAMHRAGHAHSIEAWLPAHEPSRAAVDPPSYRDPASVTPVLSTGQSLVLVGGIYGVSIGAAFFAESMFCRPELGVALRGDGAAMPRPGTDASKVCLVHLVSHLRRRGYILMDVQLRNDHTDQFGVYEIPRTEYLRRLQHACEADTSWGPLEPVDAMIR